MGDVPRAVEAVGAIDPVGARQDQAEVEIELPRPQPQSRGWDYEIDPRYMRSPAPTPEPELEPVPGPQQTDRFQTRSGRHWGLVSAGKNEYEDELDDYLGRSARLARTSSDTILESGITPHDLIACSAMTSPLTSFMTSFGSISRDIRKTFSLGIHSTCSSPLSRSKPISKCPVHVHSSRGCIYADPR